MNINYGKHNLRCCFRMIPESTTVFKSEDHLPSSITAHELYNILLAIFPNENQRVKNGSGEECLNRNCNMGEEEMKRLLIEYAYKGSNIYYSPSI